MSLKAFHFALITVSTLLMVYFGIWCFQEYSDNQQTEFLISSIGSFILATGLVIYLGWFVRKLKDVSYL